MIVTFATENYRNYLELLLESYSYSNPNKKALVYLVGWRPDSFLEIEKFFPQYNFFYLDTSPEILERVEKNKRSGELLKYKPQIIKDVYLNNQDPFLWVDADALILKDINPLLDILKKDKYDFMSTYRPNHLKNHAKFAVAVLGFSRTIRGKKFLLDYAKESETCSGYKNWYQEQLALYQVFQNSTAQVYALSEEEHSIKRNIDTIIFSRRKGFDYIEMKKILDKMKRGELWIGKLDK